MGGVEPGTQVSLQGLNVGEVQETGFAADEGKVRLQFSILENYSLPQDSTASIQFSSLLGQPNVVIQYGASDAMLAKDGSARIKTRDVPTIGEAFDKVAELGSEVRDLAKSFNEGQSSVLTKIEKVIDDNEANIREATESLAEVGPQLKELSNRLNELTTQVSNGQGTLGKLFQDDSLYNDLKTLSEDMSAISEKMRNGEGTLGRLLNDDSLVTQAQTSLDEVAAAGREVQELLGSRREDLDKLVDTLANAGPQLEQALSDISAVSEDMRSISRKINEGEGTLGKLVNDPDLYKDAQKAAQQVGETLEQSEEQGVIRSFLGIVFGAAI